MRGQPINEQERDAHGHWRPAKPARRTPLVYFGIVDDDVHGDGQMVLQRFALELFAGESKHFVLATSEHHVVSPDHDDTDRANVVEEVIQMLERGAQLAADLDALMRVHQDVERWEEEYSSDALTPPNQQTRLMDQLQCWEVDEDTPPLRRGRNSK